MWLAILAFGTLFAIYKLSQLKSFEIKINGAKEHIMSIQSVGFRAYTEAMQHFNKVESNLKQGHSLDNKHLFAKTLDQSLVRDTVDKPEIGFGAQADFIRYPDACHVFDLRCVRRKVGQIR